MYLAANDFQKALSGCAVHRRAIDGRVRRAKSTADAESGAERSTGKNPRMDRPVERPGRNLSGNLEKWRHLRNPDQGFGPGENIPRNRDKATVFHSRETGSPRPFVQETASGQE
jgi:hypothetical protein